LASRNSVVVTQTRFAIGEIMQRREKGDLVGQAARGCLQPTGAASKHHSLAKISVIRGKK
jgi:hypothetical protein